MAILDPNGRPYQTARTFAHAADPSRARGPQFHNRSADIDKLIPSHDRRALAVISSRLYTNMGVPRAAIGQKSDYSVGRQWKAKYSGISDLEDGKAVAAFINKTWAPNCDVRGGIHNWQRLLKLTSTAIDRDGGAFWLKVLGDDGFPRIQQIPYHRCHSKAGLTKVEGGLYDGYKIVDGIIYFRGGRPAAYRIITGDTEDQFEDIPASQIIHFFDPDYQEQGRGLPAFTHALEDLKHCLVSTEDERVRQLIISRLHLIEYNDTGGPDMDDPVIALQGAGAGTTGMLTEYHEGGKVYMRANSGNKLEQVKHETPGEIWENFQDRMIRMSLAGVRWPYSLVWKPAGQGTAERGEVMKARMAVESRQADLEFGAVQAVAWAYSVFYVQGRVPLLDYPFAWSFGLPPRMTVDDGREATQLRDDVRAGLANTSDVLEARGQGDEEEFYIRRARGIAMRKVIARRIAAEASEESGFEITIEDREMAMLTPNEAPPTTPADPSTQKEKDDDEDDTADD